MFYHPTMLGLISYDILQIRDRLNIKYFCKSCFPFFFLLLRPCEYFAKYKIMVMVSEGLKFVSAIDRQDKNESDMLSPEKILLSSKYDEHRYISQAGKHFHQTTLY